MSLREPLKLKVIEALNAASLDESKFKESVGLMIDEIVNQAKYETLAEVKDLLKKIEDSKVPIVEPKEHRSFGKVRNPGEPKSGGSL